MRRAATMVCLIAAVVCASAIHTRASAGVRPALLDPVRVGTVTGLPVGLQWPNADAASLVLYAIAADIDDDGDLDVVANQGSIDLAVWVNDGTGRLTRWLATPSTGPGAFSTAPGIADPVPGTAAAASTTAPTIDFARPTASTALAGAGAPTGPPATGVRASHPTARSPRAPPLDTRS